MDSHFVRFSFIFLVLFSTAYATTPCEFPLLFNFGDSHSDTGGYSAAFGQAHPPNGESFFGGPAGRYSDGRLIIDFIAEHLGLPYLNAYLDSVGSNYTFGANFATAGSTIRPPNITFISPISLNIQSYHLRDFHNKSQRFRSQGVFRSLLPKPEDFSRALYTMDIGHNDLMIGDFADKPMDQFIANVTEILRQFKVSFKNIYDNGGRHFWIHNSGPIGCLTSTIQNFPSRILDKAGCSIADNDVVQYFNTRLKDVVVQLRKDFSLSTITYVDIYTAKYTLFSEAKKLGFENPFLVCCGHGGKYNYKPEFSCGNNVIENGRQVFVGKCKDPFVRINWDGVHYTEAANKFVFNQIVNGSFSDPPIPLKMACHRQN